MAPLLRIAQHTGPAKHPAADLAIGFPHIGVARAIGLEAQTSRPVRVPVLLIGPAVAI